MKTNLRITVFPRVVGFNNKAIDFDEQCEMANRIKSQIIKHLDHSDYDGVVIQFDEASICPQEENNE